MSIYITGDKHGNFKDFLYPGTLNSRRVDKSDYRIITGDFGGIFYGTREEEISLDLLELCAPFTILFVDGNHENFELLKHYPVTSWHGGEVQFIRPHIIHLMRGNCYMIENQTFFVMGGAQSPDITDGILEPDDPDLHKKIDEMEAEGKCLYRTRGLDWFPEEMPSDQELKKGIEVLKQHGNSVDYILTHAAPTLVADHFSEGRFEPNYLTEYFEKIRKNVTFRTWYCGHYHADVDYVLEEKQYRILYHRVMRVPTSGQAKKIWELGRRMS